MSTPHIDHIGIIVSDLEEAVTKMRPLFGEDVTVREMPQSGLRVAEFRAANVVVELLQYLPGGESAFARRVMGERIGLNHISTRVDDVGRSITELAAAGFKPMGGFPRRGAHGQVAFFEPDRVSGLLFEVCEPDTQDDTIERK